LPASRMNSTSESGKQALSPIVPILTFAVVFGLSITFAVAVLMDATLVRMVIGPALLSLAGDWHWWPCGLKGALRAPAGALS
jgi:uncharacterized membrane protein YdfJ with MMPL/SSD domain